MQRECLRTDRAINQVLRVTALLEKALTGNQANEIHSQIIVNGLDNLQALLVRQTLKSATHYSRKTIHYVKSILQQMRNPDNFSTSSTIRYLSQHGQFREALSLYVQMQRWGLSPTTFAIASTLKACAKISSEKCGWTIHGQAHKFGLCEAVFVQTALVDLYSKMGDMVIAQKVFDEIRGKNVVSWNSLLAGYVKCGDVARAQSVFDEMPIKDVISWNSIVSGYARFKDMEQAYELFRRMPEKNSASWNTMITGYIEHEKIELARSFFDAMPARNNVSYITMISAYAKYGDVELAKEVYDQIDKKDLAVYNAMMACFSQNNRAKEALQLFDEIFKPKARLQPDKMTFASAISACSQLGDLEYGTWIESYMRDLGIETDYRHVTSLIDLYAKCGNITKAYELFNALKTRDVVSYTAMILGFGMNGKANEAIKLFDEMMDIGITPNLATLTGILSAYSHVGLVEEGYNCFNSMKTRGLCPSNDHYAIMVDLLGRAGRLDEAYELIKSMPMEPHVGVWGALLLACSLHNNVELAETAAKCCFELEPDSSGYRSLLANIYASAGRWDDANELRASIGEKGLVKVPGSSWM